MTLIVTDRWIGQAVEKIQQYFKANSEAESFVDVLDVNGNTKVQCPVFSICTNVPH